MTLELLPAVDLLDGQAARLVQGVAGTATGYGDPVEAATSFAVQGANWLHVVDLDAAFGRGPRNRRHLGQIVAAVAPVRSRPPAGCAPPPTWTPCWSWARPGW
jgi:phosphoribosylformimino-5-aminoimidazole carboxamide ribonucleotide (ProFAR) isomerase